MNFDFDTLLPEEQAEFHQQLIRLGEALQKSPKARTALITFLQSNKKPMETFSDESLEHYGTLLEAALPDTSTEHQLQQQISDLQDRLRWKFVLGDLLPYPPDEEWEWQDYPTVNKH